MESKKFMNYVKSIDDTVDIVITQIDATRFNINVHKPDDIKCNVKLVLNKSTMEE